ncbi:unnamed protein product [Rotaria socialis]
MATHYIENASSGNQYYFNTNNATTSSQPYQTYSSPVRSSYNSSTYSAYPISISGASNQQIHLTDSHQVPQNYLSVGGFNKGVTQHHYHTAQSATPQTRTTARAISNQDRYHLQGSPQVIQVSPQQNHFQYDTQQRAGHPTGPPVVYQTPGAAQFTHHNVDLWTENPSQTHDQHVQAQRVSVRSVSTGSPQQSHSISPQRHPDHLQQYYSQLTPEQHQQLLRQQQMQRQQDQTSRHGQQHRVIAQQVSPSSTHHHQQQNYSPTANFDGGQQRRVRSESEKQIQDEQDYYAAQQRLAAQRTQQQQQQQQQQDPSHPVGIRNLVHKFAEPTSGQTVHSRSKSAATTTTTTTSRQHSSSSHTTNSGPRQTTSNRALTSHSMTYSSLPKPVEPPVNSIEYYQMQMQQQGGNPFTNIQQAAAPSHIQHSPTGFGTLRDRFKTGSLSEELNQAPAIRRQEQHPAQQQKTNASGGNSLSSLRNHYMNQANQATYDELHAQHVQNISRTILGEEIPQTKPQQQPSTSETSQEQPAPITKVLQQQPAPTTQAPKQEPVPVAQAPKQEPASPPAETPKQESAPVAQAPKQEPAPASKTPKKESTPTAETPKQENAPAAETLKKEAGSTTPTVKKEPAAQATKKEPASAAQTTKKEAASTTQAAKKEATPAADASKQKSTSATETSKKEQPQTKNESADQKVTSSEVTPSPTVDGEKI